MVLSAAPAEDGSAAAIFLAGSAVNQDGRSSSLTAPNGPSQQNVIRAALQIAGASALQVAGLQMHGTGTSLGDPIEVGAAVAAFVEGRPAGQPFTLMASKSSLGHAEPASGLMGISYLHQVSPTWPASALLCKLYCMRRVRPSCAAHARHVRACCACCAR